MSNLQVWTDIAIHIIMGFSSCQNNTYVLTNASYFAQDISS